MPNPRDVTPNPAFLKMFAGAKFSDTTVTTDGGTYRLDGTVGESLKVTPVERCDWCGYAESNLVRGRCRSCCAQHGVPEKCRDCDQPGDWSHTYQGRPLCNGCYERRSTLAPTVAPPWVRCNGCGRHYTCKAIPDDGVPCPSCTGREWVQIHPPPMVWDEPWWTHNEMGYRISATAGHSCDHANVEPVDTPAVGLIGAVCPGCGASATLTTLSDKPVHDSRDDPTRYAIEQRQARRVSKARFAAVTCLLLVLTVLLVDGITDDGGLTIAELIKGAIAALASALGGAYASYAPRTPYQRQQLEVDRRVLREINAGERNWGNW
jgi:hypothetical protein